MITQMQLTFRTSGLILILTGELFFNITLFPTLLPHLSAITAQVNHWPDASPSRSPEFLSLLKPFIEVHGFSPRYISRTGVSTWLTDSLTDYYDVLLFSVLSCCSALEVSIPQGEYRVADGEDVKMTCNFVPARPVSDIFILKWEAYTDDSVVRPNKNN